jgi:hypothetical protein
MVVQMEVYRAYWIKCLIIDNSLCLREISGFRSHFVFLDTSISCMLDLIDPLGSHHRLPFWSLNNILYIILLRYTGILLLWHLAIPVLLLLLYDKKAQNQRCGSWLRSSSKNLFVLSGCALRGLYVSLPPAE